MAGTKYVYDFEEGGREMKFLLGGKGANLAEMTNMGLPVPPGFTVSTDACKAYLAAGGFPESLVEEIAEHVAGLEKKMGKNLGDSLDPLMVSVRSGAAFSMPGMMDTILNLGLNDVSVEGLAKQAENPRFAYDSYRRFIQMFGKVVMSVPAERFEHAIEAAKKAKGVEMDTDLDAGDMKALVETFKGIVRESAGRDFPTEPMEQLKLSVTAVFSSWNNRRAIDYRRLYKISDDLGTAVNICTMVYGNKGGNSGTGVSFTRDPATGANQAYGDYLFNAQGEDVVAGIRTPLHIDDLKEALPDCYAQLIGIMKTLENHYRDMCDIEFTVEQGTLYMLQTRVGKRTAGAALKIAVDMVAEGLISKDEAVSRIEPEQLDQLLHPQFDPKATYPVLTKGMNASPGAAVGKVVFDADDAEAAAARGEKVILVREETTPDDLHGMIAAKGILTSRGGKTSHAAVVARGMGKPCVCGADAVRISYSEKLFKVGDTVIKEGDLISIDGTTGRVVGGAVDLVEPSPTGDFGTVLGWADEARHMQVRANADTPGDARKAREFGAEGIGLCRTEHMFLGERRPIVERVILATSEAEEKEALAKLLDLQRSDFVEIFEVMDGLPVTIRLLDPPLHEFLPGLVDLAVEVAVMEAKGVPEAELKPRRSLLAQVNKMHEANPMLGLRGVRLGIMHPALFRMQVRAIMEAACLRKKAGGDPRVEIMIPLVAEVEELRQIRAESEAEIAAVLAERGIQVDYMIGTMIELPRAALTAGEIAEEAEFFSFGTNDLTQTTWGFSRDDVEAKFLPLYLDRRILKSNPFETLDQAGVGRLISLGVEAGRATRPDLKVGLCGEHGGDSDSVKFCHKVGLNYVSCSPYRVPLARLAAAQAVLGEGSSSK
ncbi:MAG: pyruvate, phosphate dikinase [Actinomycetota bacterium]